MLQEVALFSPVIIEQVSVEWALGDGNNLLSCYGYMSTRRYVVAAELGLMTLTVISSYLETKQTSLYGLDSNMVG